jgi:hypothetical protein
MIIYGVGVTSGILSATRDSMIINWPDLRPQTRRQCESKRSQDFCDRRLSCPEIAALSATTAPRCPIGFGSPMVVSRAV